MEMDPLYIYVGSFMETGGKSRILNFVDQRKVTVLCFNDVMLRLLFCIIVNLFTNILQFRLCCSLIEILILHHGQFLSYACNGACSLWLTIMAVVNHDGRKSEFMTFFFALLVKWSLMIRSLSEPMVFCVPILLKTRSKCQISAKHCKMFST